MSSHYVVTAGEYDEYRIESVYDNLEDAIRSAWIHDPTVFFTCHDELPDIGVYAPEYVETDFPDRRIVYRAYLDENRMFTDKIQYTEVTAFTNPIAARAGAGNYGRHVIIGTDKGEVQKWAEEKLLPKKAAR
ncbi:hypothetical protein [Corynebacterium sp. A21]|uniref:hypothetical protein n=1 Tax=Corynebacterium sp. A21 TaxID=3457318 RepID=UPI003FD08E97